MLMMRLLVSLLVYPSLFGTDASTAKTTDENLTTENWELILNLCDKVQDDGQDGWVILQLVIILAYSSDTEPAQPPLPSSVVFLTATPTSNSTRSLSPTLYPKTSVL